MKSTLFLFKKLPDVLKSKIMCYFPIEKNDEFLLSIRKYPIYKRLQKIYKKRWELFDSESYHDWLENDIGRWINQDRGLFYYVSPFYKKIVNKVFHIDEGKIQTYEDFNSLELQYTSKQLFNLYYAELTETQSQEFFTFCLNLEYIDVTQLE